MELLACELLFLTTAISIENYVSGPSLYLSIFSSDNTWAVGRVKGTRMKVDPCQRIVLLPPLLSSPLLSPACHFQLAEGCYEVIVGLLFLCQLHVALPDHYNHVEPRILCCLCLPGHIC